MVLEDLLNWQTMTIELIAGSIIAFILFWRQQKLQSKVDRIIIEEHERQKLLQVFLVQLWSIWEH